MGRLNNLPGAAMCGRKTQYGGDSGGPVYYFTGGNSGHGYGNDEVQLSGMHWGEHTDENNDVNWIVSPMLFIHAEYGSFTAY